MEGGREKVREVLAMLERGVEGVLHSERFKEYLRVQARFHDYSFGNCVLIWSQRPDATRVAGYRTWQALGRHVRRGERGIRILAPVVRQVPVDPQEDDGEPLAGETRKVVAGFRVVTVFDVSQTEGKPLPTLAERISTSSEAGRAMLAALRRAADAFGLHVEEGDCGQANGWYRPADQTIRLQAGLAADQAAKTLAHELGHALLHGPGAEPVPREQAETEAEAVAFVVAERFGLDTSSYSFDYIAAWAGDPKAVLRSGEKIRRAVAQVLHAAGVLQPGGPRKRTPWRPRGEGGAALTPPSRTM